MLLSDGGAGSISVGVVIACGRGETFHNIMNKSQILTGFVSLGCELQECFLVPTPLKYSMTSNLQSLLLQISKYISAIALWIFLSLWILGWYFVL